MISSASEASLNRERSDGCSAVIVTVAIPLLTLIRVSKAVDKRSRRSQPAARVRRAAAADS